MKQNGKGVNRERMRNVLKAKNFLIKIELIK